MGNIIDVFPEWNKQGTEPNQNKKDTGFVVNEKPSSDLFNFIFNKNYKALESLDNNSIKTFDNIEELQLDTKVIEGQIVKILGYYEKGDCDLHYRIISIYDDGSDISVNGLYANIINKEVYVEWFGAKGDAVTDDTIAFKKAFLVSRVIKSKKKTYVISDTIYLNYFTEYNATTSIITWNGDNIKPVFKSNKKSYLTFIGGLFLGNSGCFLSLEAETFDPTTSSDYIERVTIENVQVSGSELFIDCLNAVKQLMIRGCSVFTSNCINMYGKIVETKISDCVLFGSSTAVGTYGIKIESNIGTLLNSYSEGLHICNCTIDNFDRTLYFRDIFVVFITNCFIGKNLNGTVPILFYRGNTTHCREININGNVIDGGIEFNSLLTGNNYQTSIKNNTFINVTGIGIRIKNNSTGIDINNNKFESSAGSTTAMQIEDNCYNVDFSGNTIDGTFLRVASVVGSNGTNISITDNKSPISPAIDTIQRPILLSNSGLLDNNTNSVRLQGTPAIGSDFIGTLTLNCSKGSKFILNIGLCTSSSSSGILIIDVPTNLIIPNGSGWHSQFWYIPVVSSAETINISLPVYANDTITNGIIKLNNNSITTITAATHSYMCLTRL